MKKTHMTEEDGPCHKVDLWEWRVLGVLSFVAHYYDIRITGIESLLTYCL